MWTSLKLRPPSVPSNLLRRTRIDHLLDQAVIHPLTVVTAGAGFGKTSAAANWAHTRHTSRHVAWMGLDQTDNSPHPFWSGLLRALIADERLPANSRLRDFTPASVVGADEVATLLARLADLPRPVVLILDDFHHISSADVLDGFDQLADHQPANLRLVLLTRVRPQLRLHRLRLAGALAEIHAEDLAFTIDESAQLLQLVGLSLRPDQIESLRTRTQGWPAGLQLAATTINPADVDAGIANLTGTHAAISEYLLSEVVHRLEPAQRDFMLQTSVTEHVSGDLAYRLTGRQDSQQVMEGLVATNALVSALDRRGEWFSYHPLLRDLLLHRLTVETPGLAPQMHLRAAGWLASHDQPIAAIRHATAAGEWTRAGQLMLGSIPKLLSVAAPEYVAAIAPLGQRANNHPGCYALVAAAAYHMQHRDFPAMERDTAEARQYLTELPTDERAPTEVVLDLFVALGARMRGDTDQAVRGMSHVLEVLDRTPRYRVPLARHFRAVAASNLGAGLVWSDDPVAADRVLAEAEQQLTDLGLDLPALNVTAHRALLEAMAGRYRRAIRRAIPCLELIDRRAWGSEYQSLGIYLTLGLAHLGRGRTEQAASMISRGLAATGPITDRAMRLALAIAAVQVAVAQGDPTAALTADTRLRGGLERTPGASTRIRRWAALDGAQALIYAGQPDEAIRRIDNPGEHQDVVSSWEQVCLAHANLELGKLKNAENLLRPLTESGRNHRNR